MTGKRRADRQRVGDLAAEIIDQHGQRIVGEGFVEHLGRTHRRAGVADQRMRHGAKAARHAEPVRRAVVGVADEALRTLPPGGVAADAGGVGHHLLHLGAGAVPRLHREERRPRAERGTSGRHDVPRRRTGRASAAGSSRGRTIPSGCPRCRRSAHRHRPIRPRDGSRRWRSRCDARRPRRATSRPSGAARKSPAGAGIPRR